MLYEIDVNRRSGEKQAAENRKKLQNGEHGDVSIAINDR
jgi:hypothetical protein